MISERIQIIAKVEEDFESGIRSGAEMEHPPFLSMGKNTKGDWEEYELIQHLKSRVAN